MLCFTWIFKQKSFSHTSWSILVVVLDFLIIKLNLEFTCLSSSNSLTYGIEDLLFFLLFLLGILILQFPPLKMQLGIKFLTLFFCISTKIIVVAIIFLSHVGMLLSLLVFHRLIILHNPHDICFTYIFNFEEFQFLLDAFVETSNVLHENCIIIDGDSKEDYLLIEYSGIDLNRLIILLHR